MKIKYYLRKEVDQEGKSVIMINASFNGERIRRSTKEKCKPGNFKKERVSKSEDFSHHINIRLDDIETSIKDYEYQLKREGISLTKELLENHIDKILDVKKEQPINSKSFFTLYNEWIEESKNKITIRNKKKAKGTIQTYQNTLIRLKEFEEKYNYELTIERMNNQFYMLFQAYIIDELKQKINTFGKHITKLTTFLNWCLDNDLPVNLKFRKFEAPSHYVGVDFLNKHQLQELYNLELDKTLSKSRDIFLFCCYTGLSISDIWGLKYQHISGNFIVKNREKSDIRCYIPLMDDWLFKPLEIIERYRDQNEEFVFPSQKHINANLKEIQKKAGIKLNLTTKIGRKTFVTYNIFERKLPMQTVMAATGHQTEKSFRRYLGMDLEALFNQYKENSIMKAV